MSAPRQRKRVALCHWGRDFGAGCSGSIPQRDGLGGGWEFQGERSFQSCWDWSRDSGALVSWTPDLQKGPGVRAGAGVEWGLENEGSKDSLRGGGTSLARCAQSEHPGGCPQLCKSFRSQALRGKGKDGWNRLTLSFIKVLKNLVKE